jgi:7,8-dihydro-6-hydroxymethylpterin dimethyltransferase
VRKAGLKIVFVPTIVKGVNDHQIGDIIRLALENIECSSGISFQPVAFTGRIARHELEAKRFTLSDFAHAVQQQTGICDVYEDWFPLSCVTPFSKLLSALRGDETTTLSCHPHCSLGTYLFVDQNRKAVPVTQFVEVGPMLREMDDLARKANKRASSSSPRSPPGTTCASSSMRRKRRQGLTFNKFLQTLQGHDRQEVRPRRKRSRRASPIAR